MNKTKKEPLVSIIMPAYNSGSFIENSINSVIEQSYKNWELLITDDCSNDNTVEIIKKFVSLDNRIKVFELNTNSGAAEARNNSIKYAKGEFIAFLDSDDRWLPEKLEKQIKYMICNNLNLTYTDYMIVNEKEEVVGYFRSPIKLDYKNMLKNDYIGFSTVVYNAKYLGKHFMPKIRKRQDWALLLRLLKITSFAYGINEVLTIYKKRNASISAKKYKLIKYIWFIYRDIERLPFIKAILYFFIYPFNYYIKQKIYLSKITFSTGKIKI